MFSGGKLNPKLEATLHELLNRIVARFGGAIEFWTVVCLSRNDLGDPEHFVNEQWQELHADVQQIRLLLNETNPTPAVQEQIAKLLRNCSELRELFDLFVQFAQVSPRKLELGVHRLGSLWQDVRLRAPLLAALIPLPPPLPSLTNEQEAYYQCVLDGLFDRFAAAR